MSFNDRRLINNPTIPPEITSIVMSDYFAGHPQYFMTYNILVQALYGEELNIANSSNPVTASKYKLYPITKYSHIWMSVTGTTCK